MKIKRAPQTEWFFEYYFGEYDQDNGYVGSTDSTKEFTLKNLLSVMTVKDLLDDDSMSVELKVYIPHKVHGQISFDNMDILHADVGLTKFCDGTKVPSKILKDWTKYIKTFL